jgi:hypothetical protein
METVPAVGGISLAKQFSYTIQAEGYGYKDSVLSGSDIHNTWNVFHKNDDDRGLWALTTEGYLQVTSNQNGLSGRYDPAHLSATDYGFVTEAIPSGVDDDSFGIHFRYTDNFHFYFVAWDGGGEYGWGLDTLRLYKVNGDVYELKATAQIGHWTGGTKYQFEINANGNNFAIKIDGVEHINFTDTNNPYLSGAYGPCATSQVTTWTKIAYRGVSAFTLEETYDALLDEQYNSHTNGQVLSTEDLNTLFQAKLDNYMTMNGGAAGTGTLQKFTISESEDSVEAYFHPSAPSNVTTDGTTYPYAYMIYPEIAPEPPENMTGQGMPYSIIWRWVDASANEDGFEILDENGIVIAAVGKDVTSWEETNLTPDTVVTRTVRSYNKWGISTGATATARTEAIAIVLPPSEPLNLRGVVNGTDQITWYWDLVDGADSYQLWDSVGNLIMTLTSINFPETGLNPDTKYERYVTAHNVSGSSNKSNTAVAFTDPLPVTGDVPNSPLNLVGETLGETSIIWRWEAPSIVIDPIDGEGFEKLPEQIQEEYDAILNSISYRLYDANGEVLYEALPGVFEYQENNLLPDTSYTHYVRAYNNFGESVRSNYAVARTLVAYMSDPIEEPQPEWPIDVACTPAEKEPAEKLAAFHSGIGDNLDLKTRIQKGGLAREQFTYDLQLKGYEYIPIEVFPEQKFKFRFKSEGLERLMVWTGEYIASLIVYPKKSYRYQVEGEIATSAGFSYKPKAHAEITTWSQSPIPFNYRPFANVLYTKMTSVTTSSMFNDASTAGKWGPNTWTYDAAADSVKGDLNTNWSGAYNKNHVNLTDYAFEADLGVFGRAGDNDAIGLSFRVKPNADGTMKMYYVVMDRNGDPGTGISGLKLAKIKNGPATGAFSWPWTGTQLATLRTEGWTEDTWYHFKVEVAGTRIRIWVDGDLLCDIVDNDPDMASGAFGPTNLSQIGCSFKNFTMTSVHPESIYGTQRSSTITDVNNTTSNAKVLTTTPVKDELSAAITTAYNNYKAQPGNSSATLQIVDYVVEDSRSEVIAYTNANGTEGIKAYTTATTNTPSTHTDVIDGTTYTDSITDTNHSAATNKALSQAIGGTTAQHTVAQAMAATLTDYKSANGIADSDFKVTKYEAVSLTSDVTVYTNNTSGSDVFRAYTSLGTLYKGKKEYTGHAFEYEGWKSSTEQAKDVPLYNKHGQLYTGSITSVKYTLTDLKGDLKVQPVWNATGAAGARTGNDSHRVRTTEKLEKTLSGTVDGKSPDFYFVDDLIAIPNTSEYDAAHMSLQKKDGTDNSFLYWRHDATQKTFGDIIMTDRRKDIVVISANPREITKPWTSYSEWYDGMVNGVKPYKKDGDGKKNLRVPIEVIVPDMVDLDTWYVEVEDPTGNVDYVIENGIGDKTNKENDIVIFSSESKSPDVAKLTWYGPKITGETIYEVIENQPASIRDKFLSPYRDPLLSTKNITEWKLIVTSKNPNVEVKLAEEQEPWNKESLFLDVNLVARLINPTQTAWNPFVHDGYYYFNQKEYFLFADTKVKGKYMQSEGFTPVEFPYTVKVFAERVSNAGIKYWFDTNRSDYKGTLTNIDLDTQIGDVILTKQNGVYVESGVYLSDVKTFNGDVVEEWKEVAWNADTPNGSSIQMEVSSMENGLWSPWVSVNNGDIIPSPLSDKLRYRVTLNAGENKSSKIFSAVDTTNADFNTGTHSNTVANLDGLKMNNLDTQTGTWLSKVFDLGPNIDSLGTITFTETLSGAAGEKIEISTVTSDDILGPWDGTIEPFIPLNNIVTNVDGTKTGNIVSAKKRYLRYQVRFTHGREDSVLTSGVTTSADFSRGRMTNIAVGTTDIKLSNPQVEGTFISEALPMGNVVNFKGLTLTVTDMPSNAAIDVFTLSSDIPSDFATLEANDANWVPLNADGTIGSLPARYIKAKLVLRPGRTAASTKSVIHDTSTDFSSPSKSNMNINSGVMELSNARYSGYYESSALDFTSLETWKTLTYVASLNGGTMTVKTSTSDSSSGPWSAWESVGAAGEIVSPVNNFIRYRIDMTPNALDELGLYQDNSQATFETGSTGTNVSFSVSHTRILQTDPQQPMTYVSNVKRFQDIIDYKVLSRFAALATDASLKISTRTSTNAVNWSVWAEIDAAGNITSPNREYLQYKIEVGVGYGVAAKKTLIHDEQAEFQTGTEENVQSLATGVSLLSAIGADKVLASGNLYSSLLDFDGRVSAFDGLLASIAMPVLDGSVKFYTVTSNNPSDISDMTVEASVALPWVEVVYDSVTGKYTIASEPKRYIRYRIQMTAGYTEVFTDTILENSTAQWNLGTANNVTVADTGLTMTDSTLLSEFTSQVMNFNAMHDKWVQVAGYNVQATTDGLVELYIQSADTEANLATAPETLIGSSADGTLTGTLSMTQPFMVYKIKMTAGEATQATDPDTGEPLVDETGNPIMNPAPVPVVTSIGFDSENRRAQSPEVSYIEIATTDTGFEPYAASEVGDIEISYDFKGYASPKLDSITIAGDTYSALTPVVDAIFINADVYYWRTPVMQDAHIVSDIYDVVRHTPVIHDISFGAKLPDQRIPEEYGVSLMGTVLSDQAVHQVSEQTMEQIIDNYMAEYSIDQRNLVRTRYAIISGVPGIFVETKESNSSIYYENGQSEVFARTTDTATESIFSQVKVVVDENFEALVTPVPQQGAPLVVRDASGLELNHVTFLDDKGQLTLTNTELIQSDGTREFLLEHADIDPDTLELWVDENFTNEYTKIEDYILCNNEVYTKYTYPEGTNIRASYKLKNSYCVDYNYDVTEGYAMIKLHNPVLNTSREISVRYETSLNTAYYQATEVDLNPMQTISNEGFLYITDAVEPAVELEVHFNPNTIKANGYDRTTILVVAKDKYGNPVVGDIINFAVTEGELVVNQPVTDINGVAIATYKAGFAEADAELLVTNRTAGITRSKMIYLRSPEAGPRITVETSKTGVNDDNIDRVRVIARVVGADQQPSIETLVEFYSDEATLLETSDTTNYNGEAYARLKANGMPADGIITVRVTVPSLNITEYVNIRVNEVAPIV